MRGKLLTSLFLALLSLVTISYYYMHQRSYSGQYKTVINDFHTLENDYDTLSYDILKSSLYSYNNQDDIAQGMQKLNLDYAHLYNAPLLHEKQYLSLDYPLIDLGVQISKYNSNIEHYLMLNAGIKNSYVFLLNYSERTHDLFKSDASINKDINAIITELSNMRRLLDKDHVSNIVEHLQNIQKFPTTNDAQKDFIETMSLHVNFIENNFSEFTELIASLQNKAVTEQLESIKVQFNQIAKTDFLLIDQLAIIMLLVVLGATTVIVLLLLQSQRENRRLKILKKKLEDIANYDSLTGLLNRNSFNHTLLEKTYLKPTFLLININGFKHINDLYGSQVGDYILKELSQLIQLPIFENYTPNYYRLGGDDFGILLEDISSKRALSYAEILAQSIKHFTFIDNDIDINVSISISVNDETPLLENADMVLKYSKKEKSETIVLFSKELMLREQIQNNINILQELSKAIDDARIVPYFQPLVELSSGTIVKYEALVRQISPTGDVIPPDHFLELASQTPLYRELTRIMLEKVFKTFEKQPYRFSINLSMRDLLDEELMSMLETLLIEHPESAKRLEIELLESENLFDIQTTEHFITLLKSYGCRIAIDDFGTGYSNFSYLAQLSVDTLKIDGSLVAKILNDEKYLKTVETIVHYAQNLGVETVAEFVETRDIACKLKEIGVTYGQGYYFDKPQKQLIQKEIIL